MDPPLRAVVWVGSSRKDLRAFPAATQDTRCTSRNKGRHRETKTLAGFGSAGVVETSRTIVATHSVPYAVRYRGTVYVLHVF